MTSLIQRGLTFRWYVQINIEGGKEENLQATMIYEQIRLLVINRISQLKHTSKKAVLSGNH